MPHIREALARDIRSAMRPGVSMERKYWTDTEAPHAHLGSFPRPDAVLKVVFDSTGHATVTKRYFTESGAKRTTTVHWAPDDVIALVAMMPTGISGTEQTYAHRDDRLILPNGYLQAHPGTMHRLWDVWHNDDFIGPAPMADRVTVLEGRKILAELS